MIKPALGFFATYILPASLIFGAFSVGHISVDDRSERLQAFKIEHGLASPEPAAEPEPEPVLDENGQEIDPAMLIPTYRYFNMVEPYSGNLAGEDRFYKLDLALSIHKSKIEADATILKLQTLETRIRPAIIEALSTVYQEDLTDGELREALLEKLLNVVNDKLDELGEGRPVDAVVVTGLVLT